MAIDYAQLNALTHEWGQNRAQLDENENRLRINYNNVLDKMKRKLGESRTTLKEGLADRGMTHSGPGIKSGMDLTTSFNIGAGEAAQRQNLDLASIARRRLEQDSAYNSQRIILQTPPPPEPA
jgi:hypothetical protein